MNRPERQSLTCAAGIATYNRPDILLECLGCLLQQTRLPDEILVADASPDADVTLARIQRELPQLATATRFRHFKTERGTSLQRNRILDETPGDVVLFLDDDTLVSPPYVEKIMAVYEADVRQQIGGVEGAAIEGAALAAVETTSAAAPGPEPSRGLLRKAVGVVKDRVHALLQWISFNYVGDAFPIEVSDKPVHDVPEEVKPLGVVPIRTQNGCVMSFRTAPARRERFNEHLRRYGLLEDFDLSFRVGRHQALVRCPEASARHLRIQGGRLDPSLISHLWLLNVALITRTALPWGPALRHYLERHMRRMVRYEMLLGVARKTGLSHYRAVKAGREEALAILNAPEDQVTAVYDRALEKAFQKGKF